MKKIKSILFSFIVFGLLCVANCAIAQDDPCNDPFNPNPDDPACDPDIYVPIDDGVYFLLAGGILVGYQLIKRRNQFQQPN